MGVIAEVAKTVTPALVADSLESVFILLRSTTIPSNHPEPKLLRNLQFLCNAYLRSGNAALVANEHHGALYMLVGAGGALNLLRAMIADPDDEDMVSLARSVMIEGLEHAKKPH